MRTPRWLPFALLPLALALAACGAPPLLSDVAVTPAVISPNGDKVDDQASFAYRLGVPAKVTIYLEDAQGKQYGFRQDGAERPAGKYAATFYGSYAPDPNKEDRRVLPSGAYTVVTIAEAGGQQVKLTGSIELRDAATSVPEVGALSVEPATFSPNADAEADETTIQWRLAKPARTEVTAIDKAGQRWLVEPEKELSAAMHAVRWNGQSGGRLAPDGEYTLQVRAWDEAGNVTTAAAPLRVEGAGIPKLDITDVLIQPAAVPVGGEITVSVKVRNNGTAVLKSLGPPPGTPYDTQNNFLQFRGVDNQALFYEQPGFWRIGVQWEQSASPYPIRWGWGNQPLRPGEEVTVTGVIKVLQTQVTRTTFWVNVIQEGVGFPNAPVGHKRITISY